MKALDSIWGIPAQDGAFMKALDSIWEISDKE